VRQNFEPAMNNLLEWEGFLSNDPDDAGGLTKFGIAKTFYPDLDIENLTWEQAKAIYLKDYWVKNGCDGLPFPVDCLHFDSCVNPGPGASHTFLHDSGEHADPYCRCVEYVDLRLRYYLGAIRRRPVALKYLAGWMDRTLDFLERTVLTAWSLEGK